jgi:UDP-3-O-[3-hydroxymyristoyl] glucosamine N-acyltransferase
MKRASMKFTARQIADLIGGQVDGNPEAEVSEVGKIENAASGSLAFLANPKYTGYLYTTGATIVLVRNDFVPEHPVGATLIRVENPYDAFATLLEFYQQAKLSGKGISPKASVHETATIGEGVYIGDFAVIGEGVVIGNGARIYPQVYVGDGASVGEGSILYAGVKVYHDCRIGNHCILHSGVVIGADGFGFAVQTDQSYRKVPQTGNVILEDYCEIGANTTIDRATLGSTMICKGVKLDNLVQVAHNVEIGENTVIAAQTGISGSAKLGSRCMVAGQVGFVGHIEVADEVKIGAQSGVSGSIREKGAIMMGSPAIDASLYKRILVWFRKLPDLANRIQDIENKI